MNNYNFTFMILGTTTTHTITATTVQDAMRKLTAYCKRTYRTTPIIKSWTC